MAAYYKITFNEIPEVGDSIFIYAHESTPPNNTSANGQNFVVARAAADETTIAATNNEQAQNFATAMITDYPDYFIISVYANVVTVSLPYAGFFDYLSYFEVSSEFASIEVISTKIEIIGMNSDLYLINNEVSLKIITSGNYPYYNIVFENLTNQKSSNPIRIYPDLTGSANLNISPYIKSLFDYPKDADGYIIPNQAVQNSNKFRITVSNNDDESAEVIKTFIRGGNRTNDTNQTLFVSQLLRPTKKLPIWQGYDTASYFIDSFGIIRKQLLSAVPTINKDFRRAKGCNEVYVKFLNQKGGYSNWLFESHSETESGQNLGSFIRNNQVDDLGNLSDSKLKIYGKIPKEYIAMINDLIISPEIYAFMDGLPIRVTAGRNSIEWDNIKKAYAVNINLDYQYRFNPSLLWSN